MDENFQETNCVNASSVIMEFVQEKNGKEIEQPCQERIGIASSGKFDTKESLVQEEEEEDCNSFICESDLSFSGTDGDSSEDDEEADYEQYAFCSKKCYTHEYKRLVSMKAYAKSVVRSAMIVKATANLLSKSTKEIQTKMKLFTQKSECTIALFKKKLYKFYTSTHQIVCAVKVVDDTLQEMRKLITELEACAENFSHAAFNSTTIAMTIPADTFYSGIINDLADETINAEDFCDELSTVFEELQQISIDMNSVYVRLVVAYRGMKRGKATWEETWQKIKGNSL